MLFCNFYSFTFTLSFTSYKQKTTFMQSNIQQTKLKTMLIDINQHMSEIVEEHTETEPKLKFVFNEREVEVSIKNEKIHDTIKNCLNQLAEEIA